MAKRQKISKPSATLKEWGFSPLAGAKVAGCPRNWISEDGTKARVDYGLYTRTGQSSMGLAAMWGYFVTYDSEVTA